MREEAGRGRYRSIRPSLCLASLAFAALSGCSAVRGRVDARAQALLKTGKYTAAEQLVERWLRLDPGDTVLRSLQVRLLADERKLSEAIDAYQRYRLASRTESRELLLAIMRAAFKSSNRGACGCAIRLAGDLRLNSLLDDLVAASRDDYPQVRREAYAALGRSRLADMRDVVIDGLQDPDDLARVAAIDAAGLCGDALVRPFLWLGMFDQVDYARWRLIVAYARLGDRVAIRRVKREFAGNESYGILHQQAASTLAAIGYREYLPVVAEGLASDEPARRREAAIDLGDLTATQYTTDIVARAADTSAWVREGVARGLGVMGDPRAIPSLQELSRDPAPEPRAAAAISLTMLGAPGTESTLVRLLADTCLEARVSAVGALLALADTTERR